MAEEEKETQETAQKRGGYRAGNALLVLITVIIITFFTGGIAYGVQTVIGGGEEAAEEGVMVDGVREFSLVAPQWYFRPSVIRVSPGDTVRFIITSPDITHGFAINELGINLALSPGVTMRREVVIPLDMPDGSYTMYCSVFCGIGHPYMKGTIVIGERGFEIGRILPYIATVVMAGMFATFIFIGGRKER